MYTLKNHRNFNNFVGKASASLNKFAHIIVFGIPDLHE